MNCKYCGKDKNPIVFGGYCSNCIRYYTSENYLCKTCFEQEGKLEKGFNRWDSLVLCERHAYAFQPTIMKLYEVLGVNIK